MEKEEVITTTLDSSANITNSANINVDEKKMLLRERVNRIISVIGFIIIYATVTLLAILGYIEQAAIIVSSWGIYAHFLCVIYFIFVSMPFGYGYSIGLVAFGYSLGWISLISIIIGVYVGTFLAYILTKYCLQPWTQKKVETLLLKADLTFDQVVTIAKENLVKKYLVLFSLRRFGLFTFGISNSATCLTFINLGNGLKEYCALAYVTDLPYLIAYVSIGVSARDLKDNTGDNVRLITLIIQIICTVLMFLATFYVGYRVFRLIRKKNISSVTPEEII